MSISKNKFCHRKDLKDEASVETCFLIPLISEIGYADHDIIYKKSICELTVGKTSKKVLYKPDFILSVDGTPVIVIDSKSPSDKLSNWEMQCFSYCLEINKSYDYNPIQYFILTNGIKLSLHKWDSRDDLLTLNFGDFQDCHPKYKKFLQIVSR